MKWSAPSMNSTCLSMAPEAANWACASAMKMSWSAIAPTTSVGTVTAGRLRIRLAREERPDQVDSQASGVATCASPKAW